MGWFQSLPTPKINELFLMVTSVALGAPEFAVFTDLS
jgi:hypothetical protein